MLTFQRENGKKSGVEALHFARRRAVEKSPQIEGPAQAGKAAGGELRHHHIVLSAGTMADQQFPVLSSTHHDPHVGVVWVKGQISGLRVRLGNRRAVGVLGGSTAAPGS